jgi:hypothetical protein
VALGFYTAENAETWLDVEKFMRWLGHHAQKSSATPPTTPRVRSSSSRVPLATISSQLPPSSSPGPEMSSSPLPQQLFRRIAAHHPSKSSTKRRASSPIPVSDSDDELPPALPIPARTKQQKRRKVDTRPESDSDCVVAPTRTKGKNRTKRNLDGDEM